MFTGLITHLGRIVDITEEGGRRFVVESDMPPPEEGASVAHDGVCLTVTACREGKWQVYASPETLGRSSLKDWAVGTRINLERSLSLGDELGGHLVFGHVDAVGALVETIDEGASRRMTFSMPEVLAPLVAIKGSIAVDGASLTVSAIDGPHFSVSVIPHSWEATTLQDRRPGDPVNLEADMLARYVARQLSFRGRHVG